MTLPWVPPGATTAVPAMTGSDQARHRHRHTVDEEKVACCFPGPARANDVGMEKADREALPPPRRTCSDRGTGTSKG